MDRLLTLKETGKLLNVSKQTLQRWDNSGKLIAVRTEGGHRRYKLSDIEKIIENTKSKCPEREVIQKILSIYMNGKDFKVSEVCLDDIMKKWNDW